jgi:hypothetical protein
MSMYAELLTMSYRQARSESGRTPKIANLLADVISSRQRLDEIPVTSGGASDDLAANIDYDLALLALCNARGILVDLARFERPLAERARLEHELAAHGIDLDELDPIG